MKWSQALQDEKGLVSASRIGMLLASLTLCFCTVILSIAAIWKIELVPALTVFGGALAGMATGSYMMNRHAEKNDA